MGEKVVKMGVKRFEAAWTGGRVTRYAWRVVGKTESGQIVSVCWHSHYTRTTAESCARKAWAAQEGATS